MVHDEDAKGSPERILIRNSKIQAHMRAIRGLETFGEVKLNMSSIEISSPFSPLFHHMDAIDLAMREDEQATSADLADSKLSLFTAQFLADENHSIRLESVL